MILILDKTGGLFYNQYVIFIFNGFDGIKPISQYRETMPRLRASFVN